MRGSPPSRPATCVAVSLACAAALLAPSAALAQTTAWQVASGDVRVVCPLTVGGSFEARTASLAGTLVLASSHPLALAGTLAVDLRTLDTGIGLRNDHLRDEYLEIQRGEGFETASLSDLRLGDVDPATFQGRTAFSASLELHGASRTIAGQAEVRREGPSVRVEASFPVTIADYGIAKPQYLGVGVRSEVQVKVSLLAQPVAAAAAGASR